LPNRPTIALDAAKRKLRQALAPGAIMKGGFSGREMKRVIDQYAKATDDAGAVADLLMTDLEASIAAFSDVGDFPRLVDHIYATLDHLDRVLPRLPAPAADPILSRATALARRWENKFGYGISDELVAYAANWNASRIGKSIVSGNGDRRN
jgi:hypothetical protein